MKGTGLVYLSNHGIPEQLVEEVLGASRDFFHLGAEVKGKYVKRDPFNDFFGYTPPTADERANEKDHASTTARDYKESFNFTGAGIPEVLRYPSEVPSLFTSVIGLHDQLTVLGKKVLVALAMFLELEDPAFFLKVHRGLDLDQIKDPLRDFTPLMDIRTNYYPPLSPRTLKALPEDTLRLGEHSDWGTITFLFQDNVGGLEAKTTTGEWTPVTPIPNTIVVNAGLMLELWSGGLLPATPHRVKLVNDPMKARQSFAWFMAPDGETVIAPVVKEGKGREKWVWSGNMYPRPGGNTTFSQYVKDRITGLYNGKY